MNTTKRIGIIALSIITVVGLSGVPSTAGAITTAELQVQIQTLLAQIQALQAQLSAQTGTGTGVAVSCTFARNLYPEMSGSDVKCLQQYLNAAGYAVNTSGVGSAGSETEYFGSLTKAAVTKWQDANGIQYGSWAGYFGPSSQAKYNALAAAGTVIDPGTGVAVVIPDDGIVIRLASDNPESNYVPKDASGVEFLKFEVAGDGDVDSLTFKRTGLGATADFDYVYIYKGNTRLTSGKTVNSTTHEVKFLNINIDVNDEVETYRLVADLSGTSSNRNAFKLIEATGDDITGLPLEGNEMVITGTTIGSLVATLGSSPSNPTIGASGAKLAEFKLSAGSDEDVTLTRIALTEGGTISNSYLTNLELRVGSTVLATADGVVGSRELVTFELDDPYEIDKGQVKTLRIYGDISGSARALDTIIFYFDSATDVIATGNTYGYSVDSDVTAVDTTGVLEARTLTLDGGQVTITVNGPVADDIALRAQDVTILDFNIAAQTDIEIRNLRIHTTTTGWNTGDGYNDMKIWDIDTDQVLTSAVDIAATSTDTIYTDTINISAGESRHFKLTVDIDSDNETDDSITAHISSFVANDIKNLENNRYVATTDIVGDDASGNKQTVEIPSLAIELAASPVSDIYVQGTSDVELVGITMRAVADDIKVSSLKIYASSTSGDLTSGEIQTLKLYAPDGTQLGNTEDLNSSLTATFENFNYTITKGQTKTLSVKGDISVNATNEDIYFVYLYVRTDITAEDSDGNTLVIANLTGSNANSGPTVVATITTAGNLAVARAADDTDSEAGIILANNTQQVLAKFKLTATNEAMILKDFDLLLNDSNASSTATTTAAADEVAYVYLYDGSTAIGDTSSGYPVIGSGVNSGKIYVRDLDWTVPKDNNKTLTVKGMVKTISAGADTGGEVAVHFLKSNFKASGSSQNDVSLDAEVSGREKVVYKSKPTITIAESGSASVATGVDLVRVTIAADGNEDISWKKIQLKVTMQDATMTAATTANVDIKVVGGNDLDLATAFSGNATASTSVTNADIAGGSTGYVNFVLTDEQVITEGTSKAYDISLSFSSVDVGGEGGERAILTLNRQSSARAASTSTVGVEGATTDGVPSFIWSDNSNTSHATSTQDWTNGYYVKGLPSDTITIE